MSEKAKVKIGFVGAGRMGQCAHLKNYALLDEQCDVVALAEVRPEMARQVAQHYGIPRVYSSHREMLDNEQLDGIVASQPFTRHGTLTPNLLKAGVPVFTEKPLAGSIEMGEKVADAVAKSSTFLMVGYHKRSDPATMAAKAEIDRLKQSSELGALSYVRLTMPAGEWGAGGFLDLISTDDPTPDLPQDPPDSSLSAEDRGAYIGFVNYYIHQINLMRHLLGESYEVTHVDPTSVLLVGKSVSGVPCVLEMTPYRTTVDWQESALVCFEKGWVRLDLPAPMAQYRAGRVTFFRDPGNGIEPTIVEPQLPWVHAMRQQAIQFIRAIKGEIGPMCTAEEALEDLRVARQFLHQLKGV